MRRSDEAIPAFRYPLPRAPLAGAVTTIGKVSISVRLELGGVLDIIDGGASNDTAARTRALAALDTLTDGVFVQGMDCPAPRITSAAGHEFRQSRSAHDPLGALTFEGTCVADFSTPVGGTDVRVTGELEYRLEVRISRDRPGRPADFDGELASVGGLVLVGTPISTQGALRDRLEANTPQ